MNGTALCIRQVLLSGCNAKLPQFFQPNTIHCAGTSSLKQLLRLPGHSTRPSGPVAGFLTDGKLHRCQRATSPQHQQHQAYAHVFHKSLSAKQNALLSYYGKHITFSKHLMSERSANKGSQAVESRTDDDDVIEGDAISSVVKKDAVPKLTLWQKFKVMYKNYWYVLVPVHVVTSGVWVGIFYLAVRSGFDITPYMSRFNLQIPQNTGYLAIVYAMYKLATPARYFVTITGTTISIHYLRRMGVIRPVPSSAEIMKRYRARREKLKIRFDEAKDKFQRIKDKQKD